MWKESSIQNILQTCQISLKCFCYETKTSCLFNNFIWTISRHTIKRQIITYYRKKQTTKNGNITESGKMRKAVIFKFKNQSFSNAIVYKYLYTSDIMHKFFFKFDCIFTWPKAIQLVELDCNRKSTRFETVRIVLLRSSFNEWNLNF